MAANSTITMPVSVALGGKNIEIGVLTIDVKIDSSGRVRQPTVREIRKALRKGVE